MTHAVLYGWVFDLRILVDERRELFCSLHGRQVMGDHYQYWQFNLAIIQAGHFFQPIKCAERVSVLIIALY